MIDLHAHIIPGVDDGSPSMEESLKMLEIASEDGVKAIAATSHIFGQSGKIKNIDQLRFKFDELKKKTLEQNIKIEILPGAEVFFVSDLNDRLKNFRDAITINNSSYFLLEFPWNVVFPGSKEYIFDLVNDGFIPIICHPERNLVFQQDPRLLYLLLQAGALSQVDAGSIRGDFGPTVYYTALDLLKFNLVHIIASDCHDTKDRPPGLSFVYKKLQGIRGIEKEKIDLLVERIPLAVVNNNIPPDIGPLLDPTRKSSFSGLLRKIFKYEQ